MSGIGMITLQGGIFPALLGCQERGNESSCFQSYLRGNKFPYSFLNPSGMARVDRRFPGDEFEGEGIVWTRAVQSCLPYAFFSFSSQFFFLFFFLTLTFF